jgi:hypothetical protein
MASYKVVNFKENTGQLIIEFADGMAPLVIDVPIRDGLFITGEELDTYIQGFIPTWHLERVAQLNAGVANASDLQSLVTETATNEIPDINAGAAQANEAMWEEVYFQQKVAKALIALGVLESDPTIIPVSAQ